MRKIYILGATILAAVLLSGCGSEAAEAEIVSPPLTPPPQNLVNASHPDCGRFYDAEEGGMVTQCFDPGSRDCFTLYEPDGDQEYYCNGRKIWEVEPDRNWNPNVGWGFAAGMVMGEFLRPVYVGNIHKPTSVRPKTYVRPVYSKTTVSKVTAQKTVPPVKTQTNSKTALEAARLQKTTPTPVKPNTNSKAALEAARLQKTTPTPSTGMHKQIELPKPKVDLTKKAPLATKPKVDLTKKVTVPAKPTVDLHKPLPTSTNIVVPTKLTKPKVVIAKQVKAKQVKAKPKKAKPKVTIKKKK